VRGGVWAVVPAKGFDRGKSRLAPALSDAARAAFARRLFDHVLGAATASRALAGVLVTTDAADVAAAAAAHGAAVRLDGAELAGGASDGDTRPRLARVVDAGLADVAARGAEAALVLMADLPQLEAGDVAALVAALDEAPVVLVRASDGTHTNALGLRPPTAIASAFGRDDSFAAHAAAARAAGLDVRVVESARVAFDVDGPEDHARWLARA
jgi:2-phospho-L-lactate guanylyltransferase